MFGLYVPGYPKKGALDGTFFGDTAFVEMPSILRWGL
jgi:hypothetical protein